MHCRGCRGCAILGKQHALSGILAGIGVAAIVPGAPVSWRLLAVAVTGGAALLPDLDCPQATAARSLGIVTKTIARGVEAASLRAYYATRTRRDPADRLSGHRLLTHTMPASLLFASLAAACLLHPIAGGIAVGLLVGLLGVIFNARLTRWVRLLARSVGRPIPRWVGVSPGFILVLAGGLGGWKLLTDDAGWWWLIPLCVVVGCVVHILGDTITNSGTPLLWPLTLGNRRWRLFTTRWFAAGDEFELRRVAPVLVGALVVATFSVLGGWHLVGAVLA